MQDEFIFQVLDQAMPDDYLRDIFNLEYDGQAVFVREALLRATFAGLKQIQDQYPPELCLNPPGFTLSGQRIERDPVLLPYLDQIIWKGALAKDFQLSKLIETNHTRINHRQ